VLVNSGQANAGSGAKGEEDAHVCTSAAAEALGVDVEGILPCSTGVIGVRIDTEKVSAAMPALVGGLARDGGEAFAQAIMTTDTVVKQAKADAGPFKIGGASKGVGMIEPNLATMLSFLTTDATVSPEALYDLSEQILKPAFESLTVDGCSSTNDTVLLFASGAAGGTPVASGTPEWEFLADGLAEVAESLVLQLAADGEGANHVLLIEVEGATSKGQAYMVAKEVANSALVKAAAFGGDPNPGRLIQAIGSSGATFDPTDVHAWIGSAHVVSDGTLVSNYETVKPDAETAMKEPQINYRIKVGDGPGRARAVGCDLSYDYVKINAEYTN
jgi:glutamate N-acetyltransferase/amino-acid N-acetyltransferase